MKTLNNSFKLVECQMNECCHCKEGYCQKEKISLKNNVCIDNTNRIMEDGKMIKEGSRFLLNTFTCTDEDLLSWYSDQSEVILVAKTVEKETHGVWVEGCDYRIDLDDVLELEADDVFWYAGFKFAESYWTPYSDYKDRIGQKYKVVRRVTTDEVDKENLPQWKIKFEDGEEIFAYPEEIIEDEVKRIKC